MAQASDNNPQQGSGAPSTEVATITDRALLERFSEMAVMIPLAEGNATEDILSAVLNATDWEDLSRPWEAAKVDHLLRKRLKLTHAERRPSTMAGGLGMFLVVHLTDPKSGEVYVTATSSVAIVGQITAAYCNNWMPMMVEWCQAERPSANGYYPQHLKIHDVFGPGKPKSA